MKLYKNKIDVLIVIILLTIVAGGAKAQNEAEPLRPRYGASAYYGLNIHSASFQKLPDVPNCCKEFQNGIGGAINFALHYQTPLRKDWSIFAKIGFYNNSALLTAKEDEVFYSEETLGAINGTFEHRLDATLSSIAFEPTLMYSPINKLFVGVGFSAGYLLTYKYDQREEILTPQGATFMDKNGEDTQMAVRNKYTGVIKEEEVNKFALSGVITAFYDLPLNERGTMLLSPEISFSYAVSPVIDGYKWNTHALRFGMGIKYSPAPPLPPKPKFRKEERRDTVIIADESIPSPVFVRGQEKRTFDTLYGDDEILYSDITYATDTLRQPKSYVFDVDVAHNFVNDSGQVVYADVARIEEYVSRSNKPLLSYIFFEDSSAQLPERYIRIPGSAIQEFSENKFHKTPTIDIYHNILNIVGARMRSIPKATLTLTSIDNGVEASADKTLLSRRANTIADYLQTVWKIEPSRIRKQVSREPFAPAGTPDDPLKYEETRRVEMSSNVWEVLQPVFTNDTIAVMTLPEIDLLPIAHAESGIDSWTAFLKQGDKTLADFSGKDAPPKRLIWKFDDASKSLITDGTQLSYAFQAKDKRGRVKSSNVKTIPIEFATLENKETEGLGDVLLDKYSLVLFEFDKSEITPNNQRIVDFIKSRISKESKVYVTGYTDMLGPAEHNLQLSQARANSTATALKATAEEVRGIGATDALYDNALPEGRYYSRTVEILVKTPIKN